MIRPSLACLGYTIALSACAAAQSASGPSGSAKPPWDSSPVQTDSLVYHLRREPSEYRATVTAVYRKRGPGAVYFARCNPASAGPMYNVRRTGADSSRRFFTSWAWACVGGVPTGTVQPGDSIVVQVRVGSLDQPGMRPPLQPADLTGDLRVELALCTRPETNSDHCSAPPQGQRSSNAFSVRY
jgi:hypothetical protein